MLTGKAEREGGVSVAELFTAKFSHRFPHIRIGRPGRFFKTVRRIAGLQRLHAGHT